MIIPNTTSIFKIDDIQNSNPPKKQKIIYTMRFSTHKQIIEGDNTETQS